MTCPKQSGLKLECAMTLVLRGQSRSAASFLKCTQTPQAETCPATSCWTRTTTRRAPPCEEAAAPPRRCPPGGRGGRTPVSADQTPSGPRWPEGRPGHGAAASRGPTRQRRRRLAPEAE
uniref:Rho GTPase activating protein 17 n=1 Tax=Rousettus aegyptiacus TaxID=9407 RepID=A0A7J8EW61_ROUAE|nr:Rho GTPase activating protein 17 [Rousettus aegyptiacus]